MTGENTGSIDAWKLNADGSLSAVPGSPFTSLPGIGLAISPDKQHAWSVNQNGLASLNVNNDGSLSKVSQLSDTGYSVFASPDARNIYVDQYNQQEGFEGWAWYSVVANGGLQKGGWVLEHVPVYIVFTPDGTTAFSNYTYRFDGAGISVYHRDPATGALTAFQGAEMALPQDGGYGSYPRGLAVSPDGRYLIATMDAASGSGKSWVAVWSITSTSMKQVPGSPFPIDYAAPIAFARSGKYFFEAGPSIRVYRFDSSTGQPSLLQSGASGGGATQLALDQSGQWVFGLNTPAKKVAVYRFDDATGALTPAASPAAVPGVQPCTMQVVTK